MSVNADDTRMVRQPVTAALSTVLSKAANNRKSDVISKIELDEYGKILQLLALLRQKSEDAEMDKAWSLCSTLFSKVNTSMKKKAAKRA